MAREVRFEVMLEDTVRPVGRCDWQAVERVRENRADIGEVLADEALHLRRHALDTRLDRDRADLVRPRHQLDCDIGRIAEPQADAAHRVADKHLVEDLADDLTLRGGIRGGRIDGHAEQQLLGDDLHAPLHALLHERRQPLRGGDVGRHRLDAPGCFSLRLQHERAEHCEQEREQPLPLAPHHGRHRQEASLLSSHFRVCASIRTCCRR